jgi:hypothetical protein
MAEAEDMQPMRFGRLFVLGAATCALATMAGCSDNQGGDDVVSGGRPGSGGAGASSGGSAVSGGAPLGGSGGTGTGGAGASSGGSAATGGGGEPSVGHCSPGTLLPQSTNFDLKVRQCNGYIAEENGMPPGEVIVRGIVLDEPLAAGGLYGISLELAASAGTTVELWASNAGCGAGIEQLYAAPAVTGVLCVNLEPAQDHDFVLVVFRSEGTALFRAITLCPSGACS